MYLLDSDAAKKVCQYQLLDELSQALDSPLNEFAVLPQLKFQLRLNNDIKSLEKLGSPEAVRLANLLVEQAAEVEIVAETANPILELNRPDIDSGEAILFAALYGSDNDSMLSGDKRAFVALSKINEIPKVEALWARVICLEEAIYLILKTADFEKVSDKVRERPDVDISLSIAFGRSKVNTLHEVSEALLSNMKHLNAETSGKYILRA
ncbi:hypothetical protein [Methylophaga sp.]|uniref:hypothetical protein n=1 Tax=Methylophaga sp. TaxID=2024840 RepID=UPI003A93F492